MQPVYPIGDNREEENKKRYVMKRNIATQLYYPLLFSILLFLPTCVHKKQIDKRTIYINETTKKVVVDSDAPPPITIWVHGTLVFRTPIYHKIFNKQSCLVPAESLPANHHFRLLAETIVEQDPEHFSSKEFYIFSWSGKLQHQERINAAQKLYNDILILVKNYQETYKCYPKITIITHSHGGNVVLNMAKIKNMPIPLHIKALILLACPVQDKTMNFINTPMFERVYSLYSSFDIVQILAPQFRRNHSIDLTTLKRKHHYKIPLFSSRVFPSHQHLTQAKIKINNYPLTHTSFSTQKFVKMLPYILQTLDLWDEEAQKTNTTHKHKLLCIQRRSMH